MRAAVLVLLVGCTLPETQQSPPVIAVRPYPKPVEQTYTTSRAPIRTRYVAEADGPVDCQDQAILARYGQEHSTPQCIEGTEAEQLEHAGCYWSLARGMDGSIRAPTRECHQAASPCYAHVMRRVRSDGVVVEQREACR